MNGFVDPGGIAVTDYVLGAAPRDDRLAVLDYTRGALRSIGYAELVHDVFGLAARLRSAGLSDGDTVAVLIENGYEFIVAYHGVLAAGGVVLALDPRDPASGSHIGRESVRLLLTDTTRVISGLAPERAIVLGDDAPGSLFPERESDSPPTTSPLPGGDRPAVLMRSSGTTGIAKWVTVTHRNLVANLAQIAVLHRLSAGECVAAVPPLRHIYGMQMAMNPVLRAGATLLLPATPLRARDLLELLRAHRVSVAYAVPSVLVEIAAEPVSGHFPRLRRVVSGGAPLPDAVARGAAEHLGSPVVQGFGMTEAGCLFFSPDDRIVPTGSVGIPVPGTETRFVDPETGEEVGTGRSGELWVRGPQVAPDAVGPIGPDGTGGWLRTGDLACRDDQGYVRITGRIKSMIKYKGHQVWPAELENVLNAHPAVHEALVVGVPDAVAGEIPKAYVVLGAQTPLADITRWSAERLAPYKRVRMIERVRAIPRSATGKPVRPDSLRALVTGGSRGLGRAFAIELAEAGVRVMVTGRDEAALRDTVRVIRESGGAAEHTVANLLDPDAPARLMERLTETFGGIDVVVNNAGVAGPLGPLWEVDESSWWRTMETNVRGTVAVIRAVTPRLRAQGSGRIITVVSNAGRRRWPHAAPYAISKAALISLTANLQGELRGSGITTVAFDPGLVDIGITRAHFDRGHTGDQWADGILDWAITARETGAFTPIEHCTRALVAAALGAADHNSGRYVTVEELLSDHPREVSPPYRIAAPS